MITAIMRLLVDIEKTEVSHDESKNDEACFALCASVLLRLRIGRWSGLDAQGAAGCVAVGL